MSANNQINFKTQTAFVNYIKGQAVALGDIPQANVFGALSRHKPNASKLDAKPRALPCIVVKAGPARISDQNWKPRVEISVESDADNTDENTHLERAGRIFDLFHVDKASRAALRTAISEATSDFTIFTLNMVSQEDEVEGRRWISRLALEIECCGSDVA